MLESLPSPESVAGRKPLVAVIGGSENVLGAIESCKNRLAFVLLNAIPEGPDFWSVHQISCVVICGLDWFTQFCETKPADELAVVVVVNNLNEFSAGLRSGVSSLLIEPFSGDLLLSHVERQLQLVTERKRSEQILGAQKEILAIIAGDATFEETSRNEYNDIVVDVSDTGIGIDARVIPKIFVPFEQGGKDISKQFGGLGLGLAISKTIIDAHGGAIAVSSEGKDLGAVFSIRLPLTDEPGLTGNPC